jgi:DNA-binding NarL/FixJ family response regulator
MAKCILIVDDSESIRTATRDFLENQTGYEVCGEAVDGFDALQKAHHLNPDLIILDLSMPRMSGLQTARELRSLRVGAPIILFTMYADTIRPRDFLAAGINAVVSKMDLPQLKRQIEDLLVAI